MSKEIKFDSSCFTVQKDGKVKAKEWINNIVKKNISEKRFEHSESVAQLAYDIAFKHKLKDPLKYYFAGLTHDIAKFIDKDKELELMKTVVEKKYQNVDEYAFHGFIAPFILKREFNTTDKEILNAVRFHCTGKKTMTTMEKVIYAADKIDPSRGYDSSDMINEMMNSSISDGFVYVLKQNKEFLDNKQIKFNDNIFSIECFNHYLGTDISGSDKNELYIIKKAIEDKKGSEISVFNTSMYNSIYDYVVICSSLNDKNLLAICDSVEDSLLENHYKIHHIEGKRSGQWIIIDAYNFVIHIMIKDVRKKYDLDQIFLDKTN